VSVDHAVQDPSWIERLQFGELALDRLQDRPFQRSAELLDVAYGDRVNDALLVGKESIQRANRQPGFCGDPRRGDILQGGLFQQGTGCVQDPLHGPKTAILDRQTTRRSWGLIPILKYIQLLLKEHLIARVLTDTLDTH